MGIAVINEPTAKPNGIKDITWAGEFAMSGSVLAKAIDPRNRPTTSIVAKASSVLIAIRFIFYRPTSRFRLEARFGADSLQPLVRLILIQAICLEYIANLNRPFSLTLL